MNREITSHKVNGLNEALYIGTMDKPGPGGANHRYEIAILKDVPVPPEDAADGVIRRRHSTGGFVIQFQNGPIGEVGVNGISNEALLAIVEDRLKCFQAGPYVCRENALALTKIQEAMHWLHHRTRERMARGVEGTMEK